MRLVFMKMTADKNFVRWKMPLSLDLKISRNFQIKSIKTKKDFLKHSLITSCNKFYSLTPPIYKITILRKIGL